MIHYHGQNDNIHNQFLLGRVTYASSNGLQPVHISQTTRIQSVQRTTCPSEYLWLLVTIFQRACLCVCVFFRWMFGAPTVNYGNKTNKCIESFTGILGPTRLNAFVGFTAIRNKLKAWSWIAENYFKNNLPSKGIQVCTKGEEDQMRWHSSLTQLYIAKRSCIIPQLPVSA